jgi:hypothetical protein
MLDKKSSGRKWLAHCGAGPGQKGNCMGKALTGQSCYIANPRSECIGFNSVIYVPYKKSVVKQSHPMQEAPEFYD